ncbi:response regulator [Sporolactobacillus shoreicorticis]|uniref:Response regulator n=1 Tax=Sporolactobacillus shoreicorticis TaxID=1923877 RepID=A0ABW5S129_9BACL|nr:response regulator [Sporolactobacillus shoreicorticis]
MQKVLYIEDNQDIGNWVSRYLNERGYLVTWLKSAEHVMEHFSSADLVILDVMLPGLDGFTIGQRLKKKDAQIPILILSALL